MTRENGGYDGQWESLVETVRNIDERSRLHTEANVAMREFLRQIATNTGDMAASFRQDNRDLTQIIVKEKRVPFVLVLVGVIICGAYILADKVEEGNLDISIPLLGIEISHAPERVE